jgi:hypothetical protein
MALVLAGLRLALRRWPPKRWPLLIVCASPEGLRIVPRGQLAHELRSDGLLELAAERMARRLQPGEVLVYVIADGADGAAVKFVTVPLGRAR